MRCTSVNTQLHDMWRIYYSPFQEISPEVSMNYWPLQLLLLMHSFSLWCTERTYITLISPIQNTDVRLCSPSLLSNSILSLTHSRTSTPCSYCIITWLFHFLSKQVNRGGRNVLLISPYLVTDMCVTSPGRLLDTCLAFCPHLRKSSFGK